MRSLQITSTAWQLVSVIQDLSFAKSQEEVRDIVRHAARGLTEADGATFVLLEDGHCFYVDEDAIGPLWKGSRFPVETCISGWAMMNKQHCVIPDVFADKRIPQDFYRNTFVKSLAMVPIRTADPIGAIGIYWADHHAATDTEVELIQALADTTAVALESIETLLALEARVAERTAALDRANERLLELSLTDELTGVRNRRGFDLLAEHEFALLRRQGMDCALAFIDMDGLKYLNDTFGHEAGDEAIVELAAAIKRTFRGSDIVARVGGDEFAIFMNAPIAEAREAVQRLRDELRETVTESGNAIRASIGVVDGFRATSLAELMREADSAMYDEKSGRQRTA